MLGLLIVNLVIGKLNTNNTEMKNIEMKSTLINDKLI